MIPIQKLRGKTGAGERRRILPETMVLWVTRTLWPKRASKDQRKSGNLQQKSRFYFFKRQNKSKATTGWRVQTRARQQLWKGRDPSLRLAPPPCSAQGTVLAAEADST